MDMIFPSRSGSRSGWKACEIMFVLTTMKLGKKRNVTDGARDCGMWRDLYNNESDMAYRHREMVVRGELFKANNCYIWVSQKQNTPEMAVASSSRQIRTRLRTGVALQGLKEVGELV
jgi:hypothetical protein